MRRKIKKFIKVFNYFFDEHKYPFITGMWFAFFSITFYFFESEFVTAFLYALVWQFTESPFSIYLVLVVNAMFIIWFYLTVKRIKKDLM